MPSIVVALDEPWCEWIEETAGEVKAVTGRKDLAAATRPHFTLHVAERYEPGIDEAVARVASLAAVTSFETRRVGIFRGPQMVVALEVIRSDALLQFQGRLVEEIAPFAAGTKQGYDREMWAPHISIVAGRMDEWEVEAITAVLARRDFAWTMPLTNVCLVPGPRALEWTRFEVPQAGVER